MNKPRQVLLIAASVVLLLLMLGFIVQPLYYRLIDQETSEEVLTSRDPPTSRSIPQIYLSQIPDGLITEPKLTTTLQNKINSAAITSEAELETALTDVTDIYTDNDFTDNSTNWNTAYSWGNHSTAGYFDGTTEAELEAVLSNVTDIYTNNDFVDNSANWNTAYTHSQSNAQEHTDYFVNTGTDTAGTGSGFTWTFNAGAIDPTLTLGNNSVVWENTSTFTIDGSEVRRGTVDISGETNLTAGDGLTLTLDELDFDGGASPSGDLGGTWATPSVTDDSHNHTGTTISSLDISDDTNLVAGTNITLSDDTLNVDDAFVANTGGDSMEPKLTITESVTTAPLAIAMQTEAPTSPATSDIYLAESADCSGSTACWRRYTGSEWEDISGGVTDHGALSGLSDDDHSNYLLLAGRSGGQTIYGSNIASQNLTIHANSGVDDGIVNIENEFFVNGVWNRVGIGAGLSVPKTKLDVGGAISLRELTVDPGNPDEGSSVLWMTGETEEGAGADGQLLIKTTAAGNTKTAILPHETGTIITTADTAQLLSIAENTDLTDSGDSAAHYHSTDRSRANHTGTQTASTISDFDTEVGNQTDVAANTAARHDAVTLAGQNYLSLSTQQITAALINLASHITGTLPIANGGTGQVSAQAAIDALTNVSAASANQVLTKDGSGNATFQDIPNVIQAIVLAASDETTAITSGTGKITFRMPYAFTITAVRASLTTASSSGTVDIDINEVGVSIFSTVLTVDATEKTSVSAAVPAVVSDLSLADDAEMTIDFDSAGTGATGVKVSLIGYQP